MDVSRTLAGRLFLFFILLGLSAGRLLDGPNVPRTSEPVGWTLAGRTKRPLDVSGRFGKYKTSI